MPFTVPDWKQWDDDVIREHHGDVRIYRDLFYGRHADVFKRAAQLIEDGEIVDNLYSGRTTNPEGNVRTPYIIANACKVICKIPATLVSRAIGGLSLNDDQEFADTNNPTPPDEAEGTANAKDPVIYLSDLLEDIERASGFRRGQHFTNILQQQMDGGIVGIPVSDDNGVRIEFKKREVYYEHEDGLGCDLVFKRTLQDLDEEMRDFLHVHRQRIEDSVLTVEEQLYRLNDSGKTERVEDAEAMTILEVKQLVQTFQDRTETLVEYWANEATFDYPLGVSALMGQEGKQDEINWTLTRNGITFERNGKPRIAVSKQVMTALQQAALDRYNDETKIDHRDLEIVTIDENGNSMQVIQVDITKIGDIKWVKDIMKMMFIETETSEKAVDFQLAEGSASAAQSGVAKFYDLFTSIIKGERILGEYVDFIQRLVENCFWLMSKQPQYAGIEVVRPSIHVKDMIPTTSKEKIDTEVAAVGGGVRSKEKAVRNINENDSDTAIEEELEKIEEDASSTNSNSASALSLNSMTSLLDNRTGQAAATGTEEGATNPAENAGNGANSGDNE